MLRIDTGNTGFMLLCSSLVMLMTPGLAFFYGGLVGRKNVLAIMIQSFISLCWTTVIWYVCGYSLCFSGGAGGVIGALPGWLEASVGASCTSSALFLSSPAPVPPEIMWASAVARVNSPDARAFMAFTC